MISSINRALQTSPVHSPVDRQPPVIHKSTGGSLPIGPTRKYPACLACVVHLSCGPSEAAAAAAAEISVAQRAARGRQSSIKSFQSLSETSSIVADNCPITSLPDPRYLPASSSSSSVASAAGLVTCNPC